MWIKHEYRRRKRIGFDCTAFYYSPIDKIYTNQFVCFAWYITVVFCGNRNLFAYHLCIAFNYLSMVFSNHHAYIWNLAHSNSTDTQYQFCTFFGMFHRDQFTMRMNVALINWSLFSNTILLRYKQFLQLSHDALYFCNK